MKTTTCTACREPIHGKHLEMGSVEQAKAYTFCGGCCRDILANILPIFSAAFALEVAEKMIRAKRS